MKYGPIIFNPLSNEISTGKTVVASKSYHDISLHPEGCVKGKLGAISTVTNSPFAVGKELYTFIREVIEETPKYRPYEDTKEMVEDFKKRFCSHTTIPQYAMPLIWVTFPNGPKEIVSAFGKNTVWLNGDCFMLDYIFETGYTYLDGSPVGKEVKE